jgi:hypothetical protein
MIWSVVPAGDFSVSVCAQHADAALNRQNNTVETSFFIDTPAKKNGRVKRPRKSTTQSLKVEARGSLLAAT